MRRSRPAASVRDVTPHRTERPQAHARGLSLPRTRSRAGPPDAKAVRRTHLPRRDSPRAGPCQASARGAGARLAARKRVTLHLRPDTSSFLKVTPRAPHPPATPRHAPSRPAPAGLPDSLIATSTRNSAAARTAPLIPRRAGSVEPGDRPPRSAATESAVAPLRLQPRAHSPARAALPAPFRPNRNDNLDRIERSRAESGVPAGPPKAGRRARLCPRRPTCAVPPAPSGEPARPAGAPIVDPDRCADPTRTRQDAGTRPPYARRRSIGPSTDLRFALRRSYSRTRRSSGLLMPSSRCTTSAAVRSS